MCIYIIILQETNTFFMEIKPGLKHVSTHEVANMHTAKELGSGTLDVFSTPSMIALMENAAMKLTNPYLNENQTSVGSEIKVKHIKPTPIGVVVKSEATLVGVEGKKLVFNIKAWDDNGEIGHGTHIRFIVDKNKFLGKLS